MLDQRREGLLKNETRAVHEVKELAILGRLIAWVDWAPHRPRPRDAEDTGKRSRVVC